MFTALRARQAHRACPEKADHAVEFVVLSDGFLKESKDGLRRKRPFELLAVRWARFPGRAFLIRNRSLARSQGPSDPCLRAPTDYHSVRKVSDVESQGWTVSCSQSWRADRSKRNLAY